MAEDGLIVRLTAFTRTSSPVALTLGESGVKAAFLCDARQRALAALPDCDGAVHLTLPSATATVRPLTRRLC